MVGSSLNTAVPSIVIKCKGDVVKSLKALFRERAACRLYCHEDFCRVMGPESAQPPFKLVYYVTKSAPLVRNASDGIVITSLHNDQTLCGSLIQYRGRTATVGLTLEVDGVVRLLTVQHLFDGNSDPESSCGTWATTTGSIRRLSLMFADDCANTTTCAVVSGGSRKLVPQQSSPFLDWALLGNVSNSARRQNIIFPAGPSFPTTLRGLAATPRFHGVPIYLISGVNGVRKGRLLSGVSYVGSNADQDLCPLWTVILEGPGGKRLSRNHMQPIEDQCLQIGMQTSSPESVVQL
jgi:hypothetical protein